MRTFGGGAVLLSFRSEECSKGFLGKFAAKDDCATVG